MKPTAGNLRRGGGSSGSPALKMRRPQNSLVDHHRSTVIPAHRAGEAGIQSGNDSRRLDPRLRGDDGGDSCAFSSIFVVRRTIRSTPGGPQGRKDGEPRVKGASPRATGTLGRKKKIFGPAGPAQIQPGALARSLKSLIRRPTIAGLIAFSRFPSLI
jgi:hypothetical protein